MDLFGELPIWAKGLIAFAIVFILIAAVFWLLGRFGGTRIGGASRGRQPRLAVIDAAPVDGRRRLVLIRRDNVEHLVMIGGPTDVVIEQNIVRAVPVAPARDAPAARPPGAPEPRVEAPLAAEPPVRPLRPAAPAEDAWPTGEPPLRPQRPIPASEGWPGPAEPSLRPYRPAPPPEDGPRMPEPARAGRISEPTPRTAEPSLRGAPTPRVEPPARGERREPTLRPPAADVPPVAPAAPAPSEKPAEPATVARTPPLAPDANLADMAQRLEAALRKPIRPGGERAAESAAKPAPSVEPAARPAALSAGSPGATPAATEASEKDAAHAPGPPRTPPADTKPASPKSVLDSLEEEMASLLGRPAGKE
jgi:flagellar protein FliO/FliZ